MRASEVLERTRYTIFCSCSKGTWTCSRTALREVSTTSSKYLVKYHPIHRKYSNEQWQKSQSCNGPTYTSSKQKYRKIECWCKNEDTWERSNANAVFSFSTIKACSPKLCMYVYVITHFFKTREEQNSQNSPVAAVDTIIGNVLTVVVAATFYA